MIKILKQGTRKIMICEDCGCKFSYEDEDVQHGELKYKYLSASIREFYL